MKLNNLKKLLVKVYKTKTARLLILSVSTITLLLSSGSSFAKYYSEEGYGEGARIATLGDAKIIFDYETNQTPGTLNPGNSTSAGDSGWYVFMATFRIEFNESSIERVFSLDLKMSRSPDSDYTNHTPASMNSFVYPSSKSNAKLPTFLNKVENNRTVANRFANALDLSSAGTEYDKSKEKYYAYFVDYFN